MKFRVLSFFTFTLHARESRWGSKVCVVQKQEQALEVIRKQCIERELTMAAKFALKETPELGIAASRELVDAVKRTPITQARRRQLQQFALLARNAFSKPTPSR